MNLLLSPHNDDEALFASYTVIRERPHVVVCHRAAHGYGDPDEREAESRAAVEILGGTFEQRDIPSDDNYLHSALVAMDRIWEPARVWAPNMDTSHADHALLACVALDVFGDRLI